MLVEKLKEKFKQNEPIFINEILDVMQGFSRAKVYQLIAEAEKTGNLFRYDNGIYYLPKYTEFGCLVPSLNSVIDKKYVKNNDETFGIYGKHIIELNFLASYQVPNVVEVITNKESRKVREIEIRGRKVILRRSRLPITRENECAYTLLELFNNIDARQYKENSAIQACVSDYISGKNITMDAITTIAEAFPAKALKNITTSGVIYEIARR